MSLSLSHIRTLTTIPRRKKTLLVTLDAFNTIFTPRLPVPDQYTQVAHTFNLTPHPITTSAVASAFSTHYKNQRARYPNYGRDSVLRGEYGGPKQWWSEVIRNSFRDIPAGPQGVQVPDEMVNTLLERFTGNTGYAMCHDVALFFDALRNLKARSRAKQSPFDTVLVGVVSNSDDRLPAVFKSLGLRVGSVRADEGVESARLPGFEDRSGVLSQPQARGQSVDEEPNDLDFVITSYEAGIEKPDPAIFDVAGRQARSLVSSEDVDGDWVCIHAGDDVGKDCTAPLEAGWESYYVPLNQENAREVPKRVTKLRSVMELVPLLEKHR